MLRPHAKAASLKSLLSMKCDCSAQKYYQDVNRPPFARSPVLAAAEMAGICDRATRFRCWEAENSQPWAPLFIPDSAFRRQGISGDWRVWSLQFPSCEQVIRCISTDWPVNLA